MNAVLELLLEGEAHEPERLAAILGLELGEVRRQLAELSENGVLLGWRPVLNPEARGDREVRAVIEVKITPERDGGFNRLAERIGRFDEVESCHLMSGGYDLLVFVKGRSLHDVATFVSERLATIEGVVSTATHFLLRSYKEQGYFLGVPEQERRRLQVSP
ncbi:MAG: Lrp/AsnC family transcriptional regulator [Puniceicoccaceae bacterium]|nr:MAG: Lrp/AsnC family transcriptional regulator [Puniceicoccaceae bacterium]